MPSLRKIAEVVIAGTVVPWSTPESFLGGKPGQDRPRKHIHKKDRRLIAWQDTIRATIDRLVPGRTPYEGPVMLAMTFLKATGDEALWGQRWWSPRAARGCGDLTNYAKAAEDALKTWEKYHGAGPDRRLVYRWPGLIAEDSQVCDSFLRKRYGPHDGAEIRAYAIDDAPIAGPGAARQEDRR